MPRRTVRASDTEAVSVSVSVSVSDSDSDSDSDTDFLPVPPGPHPPRTTTPDSSPSGRLHSRSPLEIGRGSSSLPLRLRAPRARGLS